MPKSPRPKPPTTKGRPPQPDIDYGHGAVEGEPGGAQPGPALPPPNPPAAAPEPTGKPTPPPSKG